MTKITKDFRDRLMVADQAEISSNGNTCTLTLYKTAKVTGFGQVLVKDPHEITIGGQDFPCFSAHIIPQTVLCSLFYTLKEGDTMRIFANRLEKDRKLYLLALHINRTYKNGAMVLTFPLTVVRGK